jgi:hypothetical protein
MLVIEYILVVLASLVYRGKLMCVVEVVHLKALIEGNCHVCM